MRFQPPAAALVLGTALVSAVVPVAQEVQSSQSEIARQMRIAEQLFRDRQLEEATVAYQRLADEARRSGVEAQEAEALCGLGEALVARSRYSDAEPPLQQCLEKAERLGSLLGTGRALISLSQAAELTGRRAEALSLAKRAVAADEESKDPHGRAVAGLQLMRVGQFTVEEQQVLVDQIVADARLTNDSAMEGRALHGLGDTFFNAGRYYEAFDALTRARDLFHQAKAFGDEGTALNSLGRVYRAHGRLDEALKCQMEALALHEQRGLPYELMQSHNAVAVVLQFMDDLGGARQHYERALAIARDTSSPRIQDFLSANIAGLLEDEGKFTESVRILEEVVAHGLDPYVSARYQHLAGTYLKLNRLQDALSAAERAIGTCGTDQRQCLSALGMRAQVQAANGDVVAARTDLRKALETIEGLHSRLVPADFLKQNFHETRRSIYNAAIAIAFSQHDNREALDTAELASSRAFVDLLAGRDNATASTPPSTGMTLRGATPVGDLASTTTAAPANADGLVEIARRLHSTALVYWPADDAVFIWVVSGDGVVTSRKSDVSKACLTQLVRAVSVVDQRPHEQGHASHTVATRGAAQLSAADPADPHAWRRLYDVLVAPIRDQLPRTSGALLTIIPHGVVMNVSFAALQDKNGRYLLEDYAIHYAPAGAVLQYTANMRRADARSGKALLVADPVIASRSPLDPVLPPLPGAREEVARIAALLPRAKVTVLEGRDATEARVTDAAAGRTFVHFATHAIVRDDAPDDSYLAFGAGGASANGLLTARNVYDLRLKADLVVLSACRSGGGRVTGDGVAAFARAFIYAGTPSLVVSVWDVADEPTSRLLPAFYRSWLSGASKARSLRRAQLQLLADLRAGAVRVETRAGPIVLPEHPMFWAGFILIGEPD